MSRIVATTIGLHSANFFFYSFKIESKDYFKPFVCVPFDFWSLELRTRMMSLKAFAH